MSVEQQNISGTQDDLDAKLKKARAEAAAKESLPSKEGETQARETEGMDDLLSEINEEKEPESSAKAEVGTEKSKTKETMEAKEVIEKAMPQIEKLVELAVSEKRACEGRMDYATLSNNVDLYIVARRDEAQRMAAEEKSIKEIMTQLEEHPGTGHFNEAYNLLQKKMSADNLRALIRSRDDLYYQHRKTERDTTEFWNSDKARKAAEEEMSSRMRYVDDGMINRGTKDSFGNPNDFVEGMKQRYEQTMTHSSEDMIQHAVDSRPDSRAFGFAIGAIESGNVEVAAKALAFAENVKALDAARVKELKDKLAKLEPSVRKKFASAFEQNRNLNA